MKNAVKWGFNDNYWPEGRAWERPQMIEAEPPPAKPTPGVKQSWWDWMEWQFWAMIIFGLCCWAGFFWFVRWLWLKS